MTGSHLPRAALLRIVAALVDIEVQRQRGRSRPEASRRIGGPDFDLDSLERLGVVAILHEMFDLPDDTFGGDPVDTIDGWVDLVHAQQPLMLMVRTSGSTGTPRASHHDVADLLAEAAWFAGKVTGCRRVVSLVPVTHLYGLIWTAILPAVMGVPVVDGTIGNLPPLDPCDMIVAVPEQWSVLARIYRNWPSNVIGISSAGPLADDVANAVIDAGLSEIIDVYGASETGAIGMRFAPQRGYELLPRWHFDTEGSVVPHLISRDGVRTALPDRIALLGGDRFTPVGRHDGAVQIGGMNVHPRRIESLIKSVPGVEDAAVRLGANGRLKAFIVLAGSPDVSEMESCLHQFFQEHLAPPERPTQLSFGPALHRNAMGKSTDWLP